MRPILPPGLYQAECTICGVLTGAGVTSNNRAVRSNTNQKRDSSGPVSTSETPQSTCITLSLDTDSDTDAEQDQAMQFDKLGMLVAVVDNAASNFVFGPCGSAGRPDGVLDIDLLASADRSGLLTAEGHAKWMQFLGV